MSRLYPGTPYARKVRPAVIVLEIPEVHAAVVRGTYREMREHGIDAGSARFHVWSLVIAGHRAQIEDVR